MVAPAHPRDELRAARRDLLAALQGYTSTGLLATSAAGEWSARDVLLHIAAWLRELARLAPDIATLGYQRGESFDPGPDWSIWNATQIEPYRLLRPEAAVAGVVTAHARLLDALETLDDSALHRCGPTRFGFEASAWDLLLAEAAHERDHAARLLAHSARPLTLLDARCHQPGPLLYAR